MFSKSMYRRKIYSMDSIWVVYMLVHGLYVGNIYCSIWVKYKVVYRAI
jgi:hypothetical protein